MERRILYFGLDDCHRLAILKSAGYLVEECRSISRLHTALIGMHEVDAVVISEDDEIEPDEAISLSRSTSMAPLILFQSRNPHYALREFDLVVPCLTGPGQWLRDIGTLIESRRISMSNAPMS